MRCDYDRSPAKARTTNRKPAIRHRILDTSRGAPPGRCGRAHGPRHGAEGHTLDRGGTERPPSAAVLLRRPPRVGRAAAARPHRPAPPPDAPGAAGPPVRASRRHPRAPAGSRRGRPARRLLRGQASAGHRGAQRAPRSRTAGPRATRAPRTRKGGGGGCPMQLSSHERKRGPGLIGPSVAQDRLRHVDPPSGQGDEGPVVPSALGALAVAEGAGQGDGPPDPSVAVGMTSIPAPLARPHRREPLGRTQEGRAA